MSTLLSRLYNFVTDKANTVKITASRMDGEYDQLITALNRKVLCSASAPSSPIAGQTWVDTTNKYLKVYRNNEWVIITAVHVAASAMATPQEGDLWYDTANNLLKAHNGTGWDTLATQSYVTTQISTSITTALAWTVVDSAVLGTNNIQTCSHGLGAVPSTVQICLLCAETDHGWAVGDEIHRIITTAATDGFVVGVGTSAFYTDVTSSLNAMDKTGGVTTLTLSKWKIRMRCRL